MQTQQQQEVERRPRRVWWIVGLAVLVVAVIGVGIWAIVAANQTDDIDVATGLVDDWIAGWNANDPEAVAAVFTEDGTFGGDDDAVTGRDQLMSHVVAWSSTVNNVERIGDLTATETGTFTFRYQAEIEGTLWDFTVVEIELDGDLASRIEFVE
jgi:ketosteroid isomerase-like protein